MSPDPNKVFATFREILSSAAVEHRLHHHKPVLSYEDAKEVSDELGLTGTEAKVVVCRADAGYAVYITTQGKRFDARELKRLLSVKKLRLANSEELQDGFGAEPGSAYPFGFAADIPIAVDPAVYDVESLLFSTPLPTVTLEISGKELRRVLSNLSNPIYEALPA